MRIFGFMTPFGIGMAFGGWIARSPFYGRSWAMTLYTSILLELGFDIYSLAVAFTVFFISDTCFYRDTTACISVSFHHLT
jgi:hypothetical protein